MASLRCRASVISAMLPTSRVTFRLTPAESNPSSEDTISNSLRAAFSQAISCVRGAAHVSVEAVDRRCIGTVSGRVGP
jgi:hypothetical protein